MENVRSSQPCISMNFCTENKFFPVSIVKKEDYLFKKRPFNNSSIFEENNFVPIISSINEDEGSKCILPQLLLSIFSISEIIFFRLLFWND